MKFLSAVYIMLIAVSTSCLAAEPVRTVQGLIRRLLGEEYILRFHYEVIEIDRGHDVFEIDTIMRLGIVLPVLRGNNGVAFASALNYYLKYYCHCSVSWGVNGSGDQLRLPEPLPTEFSRARHVMTKYRYYINPVTFSYSMVWWDIDRWTREIDWMALNGINMPLSLTGQEYVLKKFYSSLGLSDAEIKECFTGPAFLAWQRFGSLRGWGGPLGDTWIDTQHKLQLQILEKTREFGMINVLPGFTGFVPEAVKLKYPDSKFVKNPNWEHFNSSYSGNYLLEPTDPLFKELGKKYYEMLIAEYGNDHMFSIDTYNKFNPSSNDSSFLAATNKAIYDTMAEVDSDGIYVIQSLPFQDFASDPFWTLDSIKAFLSAVPNNRMIVVDVSSINSPAWLKTDSFYGKPFIYCLEHNFGGTRGIYGYLLVIGTDPLDAASYKDSSFVGIGLTPEGIEQNPVVYDLMSEMGWREFKVNPDVWIEAYAVRRYGDIGGSIGENLKTAWSKLLGCCYSSYYLTKVKSLIESAPVTSIDTGYWIGWQGTTTMVEALGLLLSGHNNATLRDVGPYQYDVVDVTRQAIVNLFTDVHVTFGLAYKKYQLHKKNSSLEFMQLSNTLFEMIKDLDTLLASNENFLLGSWIEDAHNAAKYESTAVQDLYEFNARNQITMWGYHQNIEDYASKQWAGLVGDYYLRRWKLLSRYMLESIVDGTDLNFNAYEKERFELESSWGEEHTKYPTSPVGNSIDVAYQMYKKYVTVEDSSITYRVLNNSVMEITNLGLYGYYIQAWTQDLNQLRFICDVNPTCVGFNSLAVLYNSTGAITTSTGVTLYLKQ